jgi:hypothetical protein
VQVGGSRAHEVEVREYPAGPKQVVYLREQLSLAMATASG